MSMGYEGVDCTWLAFSTIYYIGPKSLHSQQVLQMDTCACILRNLYTSIQSLQIVAHIVRYTFLVCFFSPMYYSNFEYGL